jgi:hypothetical protein
MLLDDAVAMCRRIMIARRLAFPKAWYTKVVIVTGRISTVDTNLDRSSAHALGQIRMSV